MKTFLTILGLTLMTATQGQMFLGRDLQTSNTTNTTTKVVPKFYGDKVNITYNSTLGCGACIRGGYIYCMPGAEASDPATWGTKKAFCCQNASNCSYTTNSTYTCSNTYSDKTLAKAMCPFVSSRCGNSTTFTFSQIGQK